MESKLLTGMKAFGLAAVMLTGIATIVGSGGGGGGGGTVPTGYTGLTTPATITAANYEDMAINAWLTGYAGTSIDILGAVQVTPEANSTSAFSMAAMPVIFENVVSRIDVSLFIPQVYIGAVIEIDPETVWGDCNAPLGDEGATLTGTVNDATGSFNFSIEFNNYCDGGVIINGLANMTGSIDLDFLEPEKYTITFNDLDLDEPGNSITLDGSFKADYTVSPMLITMSYVMKDNIAAKTYWFRDVRLQITEGPEGAGFTNIVGISGTRQYYDPDQGYVELSVGETIQWLDEDNFPSSGSFILTGTDNTKARLTFLNASEYEVDADLDGNGTYETPAP